MNWDTKHRLTPPQSIMTAKMMKPITATTLTIPRPNSTSPYPLTPKMLIMTINIKKMVIQTPTLIDGCPVLSGSVQKAIVTPAAVSSKGRTASHYSLLVSMPRQPAYAEDALQKDFVGSSIKDSCPDTHIHRIIPAHSEAPGFINEAYRVVEKRPLNRVYSGQFTQRIDSEQHHDANDDEVHDQ